ncbi:MAG TPA: enolase C-terminal domain-like protein [Acidimicrobiales bacterium]
MTGADRNPDADLSSGSGPGRDRDLDAVELVRVRLPLRRTLRSGHGTETVREVVLVRVIGTDGVEGWGECSALEAPTYTGEYTDGAWPVLRDLLVPALLDGRRLAVRGHPFASAAVHLAQWDRRLRGEGRPAAPPRHPGLAWTAVLGLPDGDSVERDGTAAVAAGATALKVKVTPSVSPMWLARLRVALPAVAVAVDANGGFRDAERELVDLADALAAGTDSGSDAVSRVYVEQPLPADDLVAHARLAPRLAVPIALDESIRAPGDVDTAWALGAAALVNVKPAKLGGLGGWDEPGAPSVVTGAGPGRFLGGMVETGIGRAAALAIGASIGIDVTDLGPSSWYYDDDLTDPIELGADGRMHAPDGPGIGVMPRADRLADVTVDRLLIRP